MHSSQSVDNSWEWSEIAIPLLRGSDWCSIQSLLLSGGRLSKDYPQVPTGYIVTVHPTHSRKKHIRVEIPRKMLKIIWIWISRDYFENIKNMWRQHLINRNLDFLFSSQSSLEKLIIKERLFVQIIQSINQRTKAHKFLRWVFPKKVIQPNILNYFSIKHSNAVSCCNNIYTPHYFIWLSALFLSVFMLY